MRKLHIVMYHYTRDLRHSRYPKIKGLDLELFKEQIQWFTRGGTIRSCHDGAGFGCC